MPSRTSTGKEQNGTLRAAASSCTHACPMQSTRRTAAGIARAPNTTRAITTRRSSFTRRRYRVALVTESERSRERRITNMGKRLWIVLGAAAIAALLAGYQLLPERGVPPGAPTLDAMATSLGSD